MRVAFGTGGCYNMVPTRTFDAGDRGTLNQAYSLSVGYQVSRRLMIGGTVDYLNWRTKADMALVSPSGRSLGLQEADILLGENVFKIGGDATIVFQSSEEYSDFARNEFSFGLSLGLIITGGQSSVEYRRVNPLSPREYSYISQLKYGGGTGYFCGAQSRYSYFFSKRVGIMTSVGGHWAAVTCDDYRFAKRNQRFDLFWFTGTIGVIVRLGPFENAF